MEEEVRCFTGGEKSTNRGVQGSEEVMITVVEKTSTRCSGLRGDSQVTLNKGFYEYGRTVSPNLIPSSLGIVGRRSGKAFVKHFFQ